MNKQTKKGLPEGPVKNPLSEKIIDMNKLIISKGSVLLEIIEKKSAINEIYLPESVDKAQFGSIYYVVFKLGDDDFKLSHPEFVSANNTKVGNIVISLRPANAKILTNKGKEYILVPDGLIESQVEPDNFNTK